MTEARAMASKRRSNTMPRTREFKEAVAADCAETTGQQYAGRLHREHASKTDVRIIDFVDTGHPALLRMWDKQIGRAHV